MRMANKSMPVFNNDTIVRWWLITAKNKAVEYSLEQVEQWLVLLACLEFFFGSDMPNRRNNGWHRRQKHDHYHRIDTNTLTNNSINGSTTRRNKSGEEYSIWWCCGTIGAHLSSSCVPVESTALRSMVQAHNTNIDTCILSNTKHYHQHHHRHQTEISHFLSEVN